MLSRDERRPVNGADLMTCSIRMVSGSILFMLLSGICLADRTADQYRRLAEKIDDQWAEQISFQADAILSSLRPPTCFDPSFAKAHSLIIEISKPAAARECDWEVDLSEGLNTDLAHLQYFRTLTRVILADGQRSLKNENGAMVADRIELLYQITGHVGPPTLISSLVMAAMLHETNDLVDDAISKGIIQPVQAQQILRSMKSLDLEDPALLIGGLESERQFGLMTLDQFFKDIGSDGPILDEENQKMLQMLAMAQGVPPGDHEWLFVGKEALKAHFNTFHSELMDIWMNRATMDVQDESSKLEQRVLSGEFTELTKLLAVNLSRAMARVMEVEEQIRKVTVELRKIAEGEVAPVTAGNAATHYARAIELSQASTDDWRENPEIRARVLDQLQVARLTETCSFPEPEDLPDAIEHKALQWTAPVIPWWLAPMDQFITEFLKSSDREEEAGRRPAAVADLVSAVDIIAHLVHCSNLSASIVAANRTQQVLDRIMAMEQAGLSSAEASRLLTSIQKIPTADPFGIQAAARRSHKRLSFHLKNLAERNLLPSHAAFSNPDDLLYLTAWMRDLPHAYSLDLEFLGVECEWPDGESAMACPPFNQHAIDAAATDGTQAAEAWTLEVEMPLESAGDITSTMAQQLVDDARAQLLAMRRSLRQTAGSRPTSE